MSSCVIVYAALCIILVDAIPISIPTVPMLDGRIVGGKPVKIEEYPYQLSLMYAGTHICGASIIGPKAVLTAAHCTNQFSPSQLSIRAGSSYKDAGGIIREVASICQHPGYNSLKIDKDVSVLILKDNLPFNTPAIQPISVPNVNEKVPNKRLATVTGWGTLYSEGPLSSILQKVDVPKVSDSVCKKAYGFRAITTNMICFGYSHGGKDACQGDSGGPLVYNGKLVGIVSWGNGCADPNFPGVYTDTAAPTIANHIQSCIV